MWFGEVFGRTVQRYRRSNRTTTTMMRRRPTEPPPIQIPLARIGVNRRCIACLSFLMAMCSPSRFQVLFSVRRATGFSAMAGPAQPTREAATVENSTSAPPVTIFGAMRIDRRNDRGESARALWRPTLALVGNAKCTGLYPATVQCATSCPSSAHEPPRIRIRSHPAPAASRSQLLSACQHVDPPIRDSVQRSRMASLPAKCCPRCCVFIVQG